MLRFGLGYSNKTSDDLYRFLKDKGYDDAFLSQTGLVTIEERGGRDKFWNRVMFPIMDVNNRVIGFGGRVMAVSYTHLDVYKRQLLITLNRLLSVQEQKQETRAMTVPLEPLRW